MFLDISFREMDIPSEVYLCAAESNREACFINSFGVAVLFKSEVASTNTICKMCRPATECQLINTRCSKCFALEWMLGPGCPSMKAVRSPNKPTNLTSIQYLTVEKRIHSLNFAVFPFHVVHCPMAMKCLYGNQRGKRGCQCSFRHYG